MNKIQKLIDAAIKYAELSEQQIAHEAYRTKTLQDAANLAREGKQREAQQLLKQVDSCSMTVFDFTDVKKDLIRAVKPWRP